MTLSMPTKIKLNFQYLRLQQLIRSIIIKAYKMDEQEEEQHIHQMLPNWQAAEIHAKAANIGIQTNLSDPPQLCECCHNSIHKKPINLCQNVKVLHQLGFGVPLLYLFLQCCLIMNLLLIVTDTFSSIASASVFSQQKCQNYQANKTIHTSHFIQGQPILSGFLRKSVKSLSFQQIDQRLRIQCTNIFVYYAEIDEDISQQQQISRICSFIIHICCLIFIKTNVIKRGQYYQQIYNHLSDYSVIIKGLRLQVDKKVDKMKDLIIELQRQIHFKFDVKEINEVPQCNLLQTSLLQRQQLLSQYLQLRQQNDPSRHNQYKLLGQIQIKILQESANCKIKLQQGQLQSQNLIIVFQTQYQKVQFLKYSQDLMNCQHFHFAGGTSQTIIQQCPDPKQIMWTNLKYTSGRNFKIFMGWFFSALFLLLTYIVFYFLQSHKNQYVKRSIYMQQNDQEGAEQERAKAHIVGWLTWAGIIFYNKFIMSRVLDYLTKLQKHDNISNEDFSFAAKYALGMFFTSSIMKIMVEAVHYNNYYSHQFGIIQEQSMMFVFSSFFLPLLWLIHPDSLLHRFKRYWYRGRQNVTQAYANYIAAQYPYMIRKRYAEIIDMMWCTFLYADLIPMGSFLLLAGQCIYYWIDKYNLLRRSSLNYSISGNLSKKMLFLLDMTLFWRFLGSIIFDYQLRDNFNNLYIVMLAISICFVLLPWDKVLYFFDHQTFLLNQIPYSSVMYTIFRDNNYKKGNPIHTFINENVLLLRRNHQLSV